MAQTNVALVQYLAERITRQQIEVILLAKAGMAYKVMSERTGLTKGQISVVLRRHGVYPTQYRRAETLLARRVVALAHEDSRKYFDTIVSAIQRGLPEVTS